MFKSWPPHGTQDARLPCSLYFPEFVQPHVHWVSDAIQLSHSLLPPSHPSLNLSQNQGLFQWVGSSHQVARYWRFSFTISPFNEYSGLFPLGLPGLISLLSKGLSRVFSSITFQKCRFFGSHSSLLSNSLTCTWLLQKPWLWLYGPL